MEKLHLDQDDYNNPYFENEDNLGKDNKAKYVGVNDVPNPEQEESLSDVWERDGVEEKNDVAESVKEVPLYDSKDVFDEQLIEPDPIGLEVVEKNPTAKEVFTEKQRVGWLSSIFKTKGDKKPKPGRETIRGEDDDSIAA